MRFVPPFCRLLSAALTLAGASLALPSAHAVSASDPNITSWVTARTYARVYETASDKTSGNAVSTWPRSGLTNGNTNGASQAKPVYSDIQRVVYSNTYVYVYATGLPGYVAGNWVTPNNMTYTSWPINRAAIHRIPRTPSIPAAKQKTNGSGGLLLNGVYVWANGDAQSYNTSTGVVSMQGGQGIWNRLAGVAETFNFDPALGHQPSNGAYHNHVNPIALRYQLGDAVTYNASTKKYAEGTPAKHSPLLGFANDGLPIYGPYGYATATDSSSGVRRMTSGFVKRDGKTTDKTTGQPNTNLAAAGRVALPVWAASVQGKSATLASTEYGPATTTSYSVGGGVTSTYSIGLFAEDYDYLGDLGYAQGTDFDLNRQNVRYCVTPEYPAGTYAYFVCIDASGNTAFPDIINQEFYGAAAMGQGTVTSVTESVTEYVRGGQASPLALSAASDPAGVKLTWPSVEGATYTLASSADGTTYATLAASVASAGGATTSYTTATLALSYKVTLASLATYDTNGNGGVTGVASSATAASPVAVAPTITVDPVSKSVLTGASVTLGVTATGTAPLAYQWFKGADPVANATSATLTLNPVALSDAGDYTVVVANSAGSDTSAVATLVVTAKPTITTPPAARTVAVGDPVTFTVIASGTAPFTYVWKKGATVLAGQTADTLTIAAATFADAGTYSVVVTNSGGSATSAGALLSVVAPPAITADPVSRSVLTGASVTLAATVSGTAPFTYQWFKDGDPVPNATSAGLTFNPAAPADSGDYTVTVTNSAGSDTSAAATLLVTDPVLAPTITAPPAALTVAAGSSATFTVVAASTEEPAYQWKKGTALIEGATTDTLVLDPVQFADAALYSVVVTNSGGSATSAAARLTVTVPAPAELSFPDPLPVGSRVAASLAVSDAAITGLVYKITGLPAGLALDSPTGALTGFITAKAGAYKLSTWCQYGSAKGAVRTVTLTVTAFPAAFVGACEAILTDDLGVPVAKTALTVAASGACTGTLTTAADAKALTIKGNLELADDATSVFADLAVSRGKNVSAYALHLALADAPALAATLSLDSAEIGASTEGARLKTYAKGVVEPAAATRYTLALGSPENLGQLAAPAGAGYATAGIGSGGALKVTGKLADGTTLTGSFALDAADTYRWFLKPQAAAGARLSGWLPLVARADDATRHAAASSDFYWVKPASTAKLYPAGFGPLALTVAMQKWIAPTATEKLPVRLGLDPAGGVLSLALSGGDVSDFTLPTALAMSSTGAITATDEPVPSTKFSVAVTPATGAFTGSFYLKDSTSSRKVTFQGVLLQLPSDDATTPLAQGYFLLAPKAGADATLGGAIEFALPSAP